jgi:Protein of unknown function (DUF3306)
MAAHDRRRGPDEGGAEGFLSRWSRRKAEARQTEAHEAKEVFGHEQVQPPSVPEPAEPDAIDPRDLPDIDSLTAESDFTVFMRKGVPPELRQQALRKLWRSSPVLANLDGLLEYGEDYTHIGRGGTSVQTAYQVGRGFVRKLKEIAGAEPAAPAEASAEALEGERAPIEPEAETKPPAAGEPEGDRPIAAPPMDRAADHASVSSSRPRRRLPKRRG